MSIVRISYLLFSILIPFHLASAEIRILLAADPLSLDPAIAEDDHALNLLSNTMDGLFGYDEHGKLENRLAESMKIEDQGRRYVFQLRKNLKWSDGKPVVAEDFRTALIRSIDGKTGSKIASLLYIIKGAKDFNQGKGEPSQVGIQVKDGKLMIQLENAYAYFPHLLTLSQAAPERKDILDANGGKWPETAPVTGPYNLVSHLRNQEIKLEPNPLAYRYQKRSSPITLKIVPEESTALSLFESGKLDVTNRVPPAEIKRLRTLGLVQDFPHAATYFISFNSKKPPFDQAEYRRAVSASVDREEILKALGMPFEKALTWIPPGLEGHEASLKHQKKDSLGAFSVEKIKKENLQVSGAFNSNDINRIIMERVQSDLKSRLNLRVTLSHLDWKSYVALIRSDTPNLYRYQRGSPFLDPIWHLASFKSDDPNNFTGWKSEKYDQLVEKIALTKSGNKRESLIAQAQDILVNQEALVVPLYFVKTPHLISKKIHHFRMNPVGLARWDLLQKDE